jgi:hypothetical protein
MLIVSNTSPLSNLAIVDALDLLRQRYGTVVVPERVRLELEALSHVGAKTRIRQAISDGWIIAQKLPTSTLSVRFETLLPAGVGEKNF